MKNGLIIFSILFWASLGHTAIESTAKLYKMDSKKEKLLFLFKSEKEMKGDQLNKTSTYTSPKGEIAVIEKTTVVNGKVTHYERDQRQLNEKGSVTIKGKTITFSYTKKGKTKTDTETLTDNFLIGPVIVDYLQKHWKKILAGAELNVRLAVVNRLETVGFSYKKEKEMKVNGTDAVVVKMTPTSWAISLLVDPLFFTLSKKEARLLELKGRTVPKRLTPRNKKWKDLDVEAYYEYPK